MKQWFNPARQRSLILSTVAVAIFVLVAIFLFGDQFSNQTATRLVNVSVQDLAEARDAFVLDVREPYEYEAAHVPGVTLIPLAELASRLDELPRDEPIYVICRSGNRSSMASNILIEAGFADVRNVEGGLLAWQQAGFSVE